MQDSLHDAASRGGYASLIDSQTVLSNHKSLCVGAHVILWDGFNSFIELKEALPDLIDNRCRFLVVGRIYDQLTAYPPDTLPLFDEKLVPFDRTTGELRGHAYRAALVAAAIRTRFRWARNTVLDFTRHKRLCSSPLIVFCGLVRPPQSALTDYARGAEDQALFQACSGLSNCALGDRTSVYSLIASVYRAIERYITSGAPSAAKIGCAYALVNALHRIGTIASIIDRVPDIFLSEFGRNPHIDPYDTPYYSQHLYLDFGSSRGPDAVYPRSIDLMRNSKNHVSLRFVSTKDSFIKYLSSTSAAQFVELCERHSESAVARYSQICSQAKPV